MINKKVNALFPRKNIRNNFHLAQISMEMENVKSPLVLCPERQSNTQIKSAECSLILSRVSGGAGSLWWPSSGFRPGHLLAIGQLVGNYPRPATCKNLPPAARCHYCRCCFYRRRRRPSVKSSQLNSTQLMIQRCTI